MSDWVTIVPMSGTGNYTATITFAANTGSSRQVTVIGKSKTGSASSSIVFTQEQYTPPTPTGETNIIYYTSSGGTVITPYQSGINIFGANIISNTYTEGQGKIVFDGDVTKIGWFAFNECFDLSSIIIPISVTEIGEGAFLDCFCLQSITIPNSVTSIGGGAFYHCESLAGITIGNSVASIGANAFFGCTSLSSITIPNSVTSIEYLLSVVAGCYNLARITVDTGNTVYDSRDNCNAIIETATNTLISGCKNTIIPNSVTSIRGGAFFEHLNLSSITIPNSVTSIGNAAFERCGIIGITIPNSVTSIGDMAFITCTNLTGITLSSSLTSIKENTFMNCTNLQSITIPNSVTSIGDGAFDNCTGLTNITIYSSVTSIGEKAFSLCTSATAINFIGTKSQWNAITLGNDWKDYSNISVIHCTDGDVPV